MNKSKFKPGIGATSSLSLRVSMANLVSIILVDPRDQRAKLVLERTATVHKEQDGYGVEVRAKPFGGSACIQDPGQLQVEIGDFNFDSLLSKEESDLRIFIDPGQWETFKQLCCRNLEQDRGILELSSERELLEEFMDIFGMDFDPSQFKLNWLRLLAEDQPVQTSNPRSKGSKTARIYSVHEMKVDELDLKSRLLESSNGISNQELQEAAKSDYLQGGKGSANATLVLDYLHLVNAYTNLPTLETAGYTWLWGHNIENNVLAILNKIWSKNYREICKEGLVQSKFQFQILRSR